MSNINHSSNQNRKHKTRLTCTIKAVQKKKEKVVNEIEFFTLKIDNDIETQKKNNDHKFQNSGDNLIPVRYKIHLPEYDSKAEKVENNIDKSTHHYSYKNGRKHFTIFLDLPFQGGGFILLYHFSFSRFLLLASKFSAISQKAIPAITTSKKAIAKIIVKMLSFIFITSFYITNILEGKDKLASDWNIFSNFFGINKPYFSEAENANQA